MNIPFSQIKGLLFDKDGTLFGFQQSWSQWAHDFISGIGLPLEAADALGWEQFSILGHSMGAALGSLTAGAFPERDLDQGRHVRHRSGARRQGQPPAR